MVTFTRKGVLRSIAALVTASALIWSYTVCYGHQFVKNGLSVFAMSSRFSVKTASPLVVSASDFIITEGDGVSYRSHISVEQTSGEAPDIRVDNSQADPDKPGVYPVRYTVTDRLGNSATVTVHMTVEEKVTEFTEAEHYIQEQTDRILAEILQDDMSQMQKAYTIYRYVRQHLSYADSSDKSDYRMAARDGLKKRTGDCYTYFAVAKVLLDAAGIQNRDVVKQRLSEKQAMHYWSLINVGTGWYHYDTTEFKAGSRLFMVTDEELKKWDDQHYPDAHRFDDGTLPVRAEDSVQYMVDYSAKRLKNE